MKITTTRLTEALIVAVHGRLDSNTSSELERELLDLIAKGERRVVLDLSQLAYVSSAGLRTVLLAAKKFQNTDGKLVLCKLTDPVRKVFDVAGFLSILTVRPSLDEALREIESG